MNFEDLLRYCVSQGASDIHLHAGMPPHIRVNGSVKPLGEAALTPNITEGLVGIMANDRQKATFEERAQVDLAYSVPGVARFRVNLFRQRGSVSAVLRVVNATAADLSKVNVPEDIMEYVAHQERGIVLVTGPTGSGKSTTLAAVLDRINASRAGTIITIEDPIEFLHKNRKSVVVQREVGADAPSMADALVAAMRQDPDVIMIGEIRDYATAAAAISAAQTGHLVFSTLHTIDTIRTVNRVMELFPAHEREQARILFAESLVAVISQRLLPRAEGKGRVAALEILKGNLRVKEMVKDEARTPLLKDAIKDGRQDGMISFDEHLAELYAEGVITLDTGMSAATTPHEFKLLAQEKEAALKFAASTSFKPEPTTTPAPAPQRAVEPTRYGR
jgi:twitching motility protein PilT